MDTVPFNADDHVGLQHYPKDIPTMGFPLALLLLEAKVQLF